MEAAEGTDQSILETPLKRKSASVRGGPKTKAKATAFDGGSSPPAELTLKEKLGKRSASTAIEKLVREDVEDKEDMEEQKVLKVTLLGIVKVELLLTKEKEEDLRRPNPKGIFVPRAISFKDMEAQDIADEVQELL